MTATVDVMELARAERADLADLLASLTPDQWDAATLCDGWRVRDVVAHVYSYDGLGWGEVAARLLRVGPKRVNDAGIRAAGDPGPDELVATARRCVRPRGFIAGRGGRVALLDGMIHQQDIRRPLGLHRDIPADRLVAALDTARFAPPIGTPRRIRGLRLRATDVGWSAGKGPLVEGPGEALLLAVGGRRGVAGELAGPGAEVLAGRIG